MTFLAFLNSKKRRFFAVFIIIALVTVFFSGASYAKELQVGVSPILLDLGTINSGESIVPSFFIVTSSQDEIIVNLASDKTNFNFFRKPEFSDIVDKVSEEESHNWVYFPSNPYVLKSANETLRTKGGRLSDWKKVSFILNVPKDAEPCNHAFQIRPVPAFTKEYGNAVSIAAITAITVKFDIKGNCIVEGKLLDILQRETASGEKVIMDIYFQNTGTATFSAHAPIVSVYYENGTKIDTKSSETIQIKPGEIAVLSTSFSPERFIKGENYVVNTTIVYGAKSITKEVLLPIHPPTGKVIAKQDQTTASVGNNYLFLVLLLIIIFTAYRIYKGDERK